MLQGTNQPPAKREPPHKDVTPEQSTVLGLSFAMELGYTISIPAVLFGIGGGYLDRYLNSSHWFLFLGIALAFAISFTTVYRKVKLINDNMPKVLPKKRADPVDLETAKEQELLHDLFRPPSV